MLENGYKTILDQKVKEIENEFLDYHNAIDVLHQDIILIRERQVIIDYLIESHSLQTEEKNLIPCELLRGLVDTFSRDLLLNVNRMFSKILCNDGETLSGFVSSRYDVSVKRGKIRELIKYCDLNKEIFEELSQNYRDKLEYFSVPSDCPNIGLEYAVVSVQYAISGSLDNFYYTYQSIKHRFYNSGNIYLSEKIREIRKLDEKLGLATRRKGDKGSFRNENISHLDNKNGLPLSYIGVRGANMKPLKEIIDLAESLIDSLVFRICPISPLGKPTKDTNFVTDFKKMFKLYKETRLNDQKRLKSLLEIPN